MILIRNVIKKLRPQPSFFYDLRVRSSMKSMTPILYGDEASPPVRFVMMTAATLGVQLSFHDVDLFKGENKSDFFTKINPLQKVPVLAVGDDVICDSHAIAHYLCRSKDGQDLYPEDIIERSKVDQMLFFNAGALFPAESSIYTDFFADKWPVEENRIQHWYKLLDFLEHKLTENKWLTGDKMLLCDLCCGATVTSFQCLVPLGQHHIKTTEWINNLQKLSCYDVNFRGLERLKHFIRAKNDVTTVS